MLKNVNKQETIVDTQQKTWGQTLELVYLLFNNCISSSTISTICIFNNVQISVLYKLKNRIYVDSKRGDKSCIRDDKSCKRGDKFAIEEIKKF